MFDASKVSFGSGLQLWDVFCDGVLVGSCCNKGDGLTAYTLAEDVLGQYPNGTDAAKALIKDWMATEAVAAM
ncbi:MAG: hypothetical protein AAGA46_00430 [Cyanobacteria bacterium P01_F01_bin.13]